MTTKTSPMPSVKTSIATSATARAEDSRRRRALGKNVRRVLFVLLGLGALTLLYFAFRPKPVRIDLAKVTRGALVVAVEETGMTRIKDRYLVSASVTGNTPRFALEPGDEVKEGDVLVRIAPATSPLLDETSRAAASASLAVAMSALGQAQAQEERATAARLLSEQELARTRSLVTSGAMARQVLEEAEFQDRMRSEELRSATFAVKVATEEVRRARALLGKRGTPETMHDDKSFDVRAPTSGRVLKVHQKSAGVVQAGSPLVEMGDDSLLEAVVDLLTVDAVHVRVGTPVVIQGFDGGERKLTGRVRQIEPSAFTRPSALGVDEQRVNIIIALTDPREQWADLRDGYHVEVRFVLWRGEDVLKVPNGAVFRRGDRWAVYTIDNTSAPRAHLTTVTVGHRGESEVEILSGLGANDAIAVHPGDSVKDGVRVEARSE